MPKAGSGKALHTREDNLIVDVKDLGLEFCGLVDVASLVNNDDDRMFITYYRRRAGVSPICGCSTAAANCQLVVAEFLSPRNGDYYMATTRADPSRFVTIYSMQLQQPGFASHCSQYQQHGGQIMLFPRNNDSYLYLVTGNDNVVRFNIGHVPASGGLMPEIVVAGAGGTPMGCSLDYDHSNLLCASVDKDLNEQVSAMPISYDRRSSSAAAVATTVINHGRSSEGGAVVPSIAGGVYGNIPTDTSSKKMRFLYAYKSHPWFAEEIAKGHYTAVGITKTMCSTNSPLPCTAAVFSDSTCHYFGTNNKKDAVILNANAVLQVVSHGHCALALAAAADGYLWQVLTLGFALVFAFALVYCTVFAPGGEQGRNTCCSSVTTNTTEINNDGSIELSMIDNRV